MGLQERHAMNHCWGCERRQGLQIISQMLYPLPCLTAMSQPLVMS